MPFFTCSRLRYVLNINKGEENELIVTATEKQTIDGAYFLFVFKHLQTNIQRAFILEDTSQFPNRYNSFTFTEGSDEDHTLEPGQHDYTIYAQASSSNLNPDLADEVVEIGIAYVSGVSDETASFQNNQTYKAFA